MPENLQKSDDYISIESVKKIFLDFFRISFKAFDFIILSIQRRLGLFAFCCLLGLASGYIYYWQNPPYYKTEMIVHSNDLPKKAYYEILKNLDNLITSQSYTAFSSELKVAPDLSKKVVSIEAIGMNNVTLEADTSTRIGQPFKIKMKTINTQAIPVLQNALLNYLNNGPYLKLIKDGEKKIYIEKLQFINYEQKKLDSLISDYRVAVAAMKVPATFFNNAMDPAALYQHALKLDSVKENAQRWLNNKSEAILLIDGFKSPANPQSTSLVISLLSGLTVGVIIGILLVILAHIKKAIS